jgi:adenylate cyclase
VGDDERVFTPTDVAVLAAVRELIELWGTEPETVLQLTRVIGQSLARIADAQLTATATRIEELRGSEGFDATAIAAIVARVEVLAPRLEQSLGYVWRRHLLASLRRLAATPSATDHSVTVGFADLVGFTALSRALDPKALAAMVDRFEGVAYEHIPEHGGRVIKFIGDEVMFAAEQPAVGAEIALALAEAHASDAALPDVRVGLAYGPVLPWEGDLFGPTVNLASRLVNLARPNTVIISETLGNELRADSRFSLRHLRPLPLKGFGRMPVWVLRRGAGDKVVP